MDHYPETNRRHHGNNEIHGKEDSNSILSQRIRPINGKQAKENLSELPEGGFASASSDNGGGRRASSASDRGGQIGKVPDN